MIKKTLGGERLGSGSNMKVELHGYERSTHDLGYIWRSTIAAGTLVPFLHEVGLPGDTFDIDLDADIKTHPTLGPLFGSFKVQLDIFQAPMRLYNALLHNNALNIGRQMNKVKIPQMTLTAHPTKAENTDDIDNSQVNPSSLLAYLGIRGVGQSPATTVTRDVNALKLLMYWDIYKNYYANKQEEIGAVLHTPQSAIARTVISISIMEGVAIQKAPTISPQSLMPANLPVRVEIQWSETQPNPNDIYIKTVEYGTIALSSMTGEWNQSGDNLYAQFKGQPYMPVTILNWDYRTETDPYNGLPKVQTFVLSDIDEMRNRILAFQSTTTPFNVNTQNLTPYQWILGETSGIPHILSSQEGLALKTYQSDLFNNWLSTEWIDGTNGINAITAISTVGDKFTIDTLNLSKKVYDMLNRIAISGGTYDDWQDAVYTHARHRMVSSPVYQGGLIKELVFQEVVSNSATSTDGSGDQPTGTLSGKGVMAKKHKGGKIIVKVDEPSYILGLISLTPRIDYSQGNKWDTHLKTMDDLHKPALDQIGFQDLIIEQMAWWDTRYDNISGVWRQHSAGKQPAWLNYMTNVNEVHGNFAIANNEMFMTLNRRYEYDGTTIGDLTTYIDPAKFNFIFAQTSRDSQNFWAQIAVDITARRKMSAKVMPNL